MYQKNDSFQNIVAFLHSDETSVWSTGHPTKFGLITYSLVIPMICGFGIIANLLNFIIFSRPRMTATAYCYFTVISIFDCISCALLFFSCLARGIYRQNLLWTKYDTLWYLPISGITRSFSNLITVAVTLDRLLYIKCFLPRGAPKFCRPAIAKKVIFSSLMVATILNIPPFFIYTEDQEKCIIITTEFFESTFYTVYNWIKFVILGLLPAIFLICANGIMLSIIRKWSKCKHLLKNSGCRERRRIFNQTHLTITLIAVVCLFLVAEIPTYFASRKSAISMLFQGDLTQSESTVLENFRIVATLLIAIHLSFNILIYSTLHPPYLVELFDVLHIISYQCKLFNCLNCNDECKQQLVKRKNDKKYTHHINICIIHGMGNGGGGGGGDGVDGNDGHVNVNCVGKCFSNPIHNNDNNNNNNNNSNNFCATTINFNDTNYKYTENMVFTSTSCNNKQNELLKNNKIDEQKLSTMTNVKNYDENINNNINNVIDCNDSKECNCINCKKNISFYENTTEQHGTNTINFRKKSFQSHENSVLENSFNEIIITDNNINLHKTESSITTITTNLNYNNKYSNVTLLNRFHFNSSNSLDNINLKSIQTIQTNIIDTTTATNSIYKIYRHNSFPFCNNNIFHS